MRAAFGETAGPGEVGLDDVDGVAGDQLAKTVEPDLGLLAGDGVANAAATAALSSMSSGATGASIQYSL
jgi:hypothetical protein